MRFYRPQRRRVTSPGDYPLPGADAPEERDPQLRDKIARELAVIVRQLMQQFSDPMSAARLLQSQQNSDRALSIKRDADPTFDFAAIWKCCRRPAGCLWGMPVSSRVITVNISITRIWPIWRPTATGMCSAWKCSGWGCPWCWKSTGWIMRSGTQSKVCRPTCRWKKKATATGCRSATNPPRLNLSQTGNRRSFCICPPWGEQSTVHPSPYIHPVSLWKY